LQQQKQQQQPQPFSGSASTADSGCGVQRQLSSLGVPQVAAPPAVEAQVDDVKLSHQQQQQQQQGELLPQPEIQRRERQRLMLEALRLEEEKMRQLAAQEVSR
jgi:hypothetical protein